MSDSKAKYEEIIECQSRSGLGTFHQTTTQDNFEEEILDEYFVKSEETLMRDLVEEFKNWENAWDFYNEYDNQPQPLNADQFAKELSKKYKISERC